MFIKINFFLEILNFIDLYKVLFLFIIKVDFLIIQL